MAQLGGRASVCCDAGHVWIKDERHVLRRMEFVERATVTHKCVSQSLPRARVGPGVLGSKANSEIIKMQSMFLVLFLMTMVAVFYNNCSPGESPLLAHFFLTHSPVSLAPQKVCEQHVARTLAQWSSSLQRRPYGSAAVACQRRPRGSTVFTSPSHLRGGPEAAVSFSASLSQPGLRAVVFAPLHPVVRLLVPVRACIPGWLSK